MSRLLFSPPPPNNLPPFPDQLQADEPHRFTVINVKSHKPIVFRSSSSLAGGMQRHNLLHITPPTGVLEVPRAGLPFSSGRKHSIIHAYRFLFHHSTVCWCRFAARAFRKGLLLRSLFFTAPSKKAQEGPPPRYTKVFKRCTFTSEKKVCYNNNTEAPSRDSWFGSQSPYSRRRWNLPDLAGHEETYFMSLLNSKYWKVFSSAQPPRACTFPQLYKDF